MCTTCPIGVDALRNKTRTQLVLHLQFLEPLPYTAQARKFRHTSSYLGLQACAPSGLVAPTILNFKLSLTKTRVSTN